MKVLYATSEAAPFVKTGGLGDVGGALPKALVKKKTSVRVIMPLYGTIGQQWREKMKFIKYIFCNLGWRSQYCGIFELKHEGVVYYFVDNEQYFKGNEIYGRFDDGERFAFFSRAVAAILPDLPWKPDVIHCNDWQTALIPLYLQFGPEQIRGIKTVFTIHNIEYQGRFSQDFFGNILGLPWEYYYDYLEYMGGISFVKGAILMADAVTTVSPTYADELTYAYYAHGLDGLLRDQKHKLTGIRNGIDTQIFDPQTDEALFKNYGCDSIGDKRENKLGLQKLLGLNQNADIPVIGMVTRLAVHKGIDLVASVLEPIMDLDVQFALLGCGEWHFEHLFTNAQNSYRGRLSANVLYNNTLANQIYAGADLFLMPSQSEPCGLAQMIAMQYGTLPLVRETGGLRDTVKPYNPETGAGNGFSFANYDANDMFYVLRQAVDLYRNNPTAWRTLQTAGMTADWSWAGPASQYIKLYNRLMKG